MILTPDAEVGIREAFQYIWDHSPEHAEIWLRKLNAEIDSLESMPERFGFARERHFFEEELRQIIFHSHRIIFWVSKETRTVHVVSIRHSRQLTLGEEE